MTPKQKENMQLLGFGLIVVTMTCTMKWWIAPFVRFVAELYGM